MDWTPEQEQAIDQSGTNILVSAGAGSGKTAVLTERVKRKVLHGTSVLRLLVLTFTNAAAAEMKDRIRKALKDTKGLEEEASLVDSSYISTFDSFALSIVKKYHIRLNIPEEVGITNELVLIFKKEEILDELFEKYYQKPTKEFKQLIHDFCLKEDQELKNAFLEVYKRIELKYDKTAFLNHYFEIYNEDKYNDFIEEYLDLLKQKQKNIIQMIRNLRNYFDEDFMDRLEENYKDFMEANTYDELLNSMNFETIKAPRGSLEEGKFLKEQMTSALKEFRDNYLIYDSIDEMKNELLSTNDNQKIIIEILKEFDQILEDYKHQNNIYSFNDIARMAIEVVENNPDIREELTDSFDEILVDEYQDTSDIQEKFISLISKNNVYMVGDIKQSIYRFRNANPDLFQQKYNLYRDTNEGMKIDLLQNFRSRKEVLEDINLLFNPIMDEKIGGAAYPESHQMIFGNDAYNKKGKTEENNHMTILTYNDKELDKNISKTEEEAFIIGNDILEKMKNHYPVYDKEIKSLRPVEYRDFVILLDRGTEFDTYKKIFEYLQIPLQMLVDESFQKDDDSIIFKNLLKLILCVKQGEITPDFEYNFVSLSRSFLYRLKDEEIYERVLKKNYQDTKLYQDALIMSEWIDHYNLSEFIRKAFHFTNYDQIMLTTSDIYGKRVREEFFYQLAQSYEKLGNTIYEFVEYLDQVFESKMDLTFNMSSKTANCCRILTIHKSKGLEYPICYYAGYTSNFNFSELNSRILFDKEYGLILPKVEEYYKDTILKTLLKNRVRLEEISEKIRLFYVATTRAKEKMIFVLPEFEEIVETGEKVDDTIREKYYSFYHIVKSIATILKPYVQTTNIEISKDYLTKREIKTLASPKTNIVMDEYDKEKELIEEKHFSKESNHMVTKEEKEAMTFGTLVHEYLELMDFANPTLLEMIPDSAIKNKIQAFLQSDLIKDAIHNKMYKEYEFYEEEDHILRHGMIDLLIDMNDSYRIIDYKLKNIEDPNYQKQLNGYRHYIEKKTGKKATCYLFSILDEKWKEVEEIE